MSEGISLHNENQYVSLHHKGNNEIEIIRSTEFENLIDVNYLENQLIPRLGFNNENLTEQPEIVRSNIGGLRIWQYPNQFSKYLVFFERA